MRAKYIEEEFPRYFLTAEDPDGYSVDVGTVNGDVVYEIGKIEASRLIADRDALLDKLIATALAFNEANPEAFSRFWYGA